jgi:uncharacterized membrane protein HdeD (DUF308 family)
VLEVRKKHTGAGTQILLVIGILQIAAGLYSLIQDPKQYPLAGAIIAIGLSLIFLLRFQTWMLFRQNSKLQEPFDAGHLR